MSFFYSRKMFRIVDKEKNGRISFKNFLDTVILFSKGTNQTKQNKTKQNKTKQNHFISSEPNSKAKKRVII